MQKNRKFTLLILTAVTITVPLFVNIGCVKAQDYVPPLTGVGTDYCLYYSNSAMSVWTQYTWTFDGVTYNGHVDLLNAWKPLFDTPKMGFTFPNVPQVCSYLEEEKMEILLQLFSARGVKVIAQLFPSYNSGGYLGSSQLTADWLDFVEHWKGDSRIAAIGLYEEPTSVTANRQGKVNDWNDALKTGGVYDQKLLAKYFVTLTHQIHQHDPNRVVIFPFLGLSYWDQNELFADFEMIRQETGINILTEPNTIFDIVHPYLFDSTAGSDLGVDPAGKALMYENQFIIPWINKVGSGKIHCGETFMFTHPCYETGYAQPDMARQHEFLVSMINVFAKYKMGFQLFGILGWSQNYKPPGYSSAPYNAHKAAVDASNYASFISAPCVEIWTNKANHAKGETLYAYVQASNMGPAIPVKVNVWFGLPGEGTYKYTTWYTGPMPGYFTSPVYVFGSFMIPSYTPSGTYSVNVEFRNPSTNALINSDTYIFTIT